MSKIENPHDKFFKETMSDKENARSFLENYLPNEISILLDLNDLEILKDSFIEKELRETFSDLLYKVKIDEKNAFLYFLFEHKSYPAPKTALQLLKYMTAIWNLKSKQKEKLPIIIPLVLYHGTKKWNIGIKLSDIVKSIPKNLEKYFPNFQYILYDLQKYKDSDFKGSKKLTLFMQVMKYILMKKEFYNNFEQILINADKLLIENKNNDFFQTLFIYIINCKEDIDEKKIIDISRKISKQGESEIMTLAEKWENDGRQKGLLEGLAGMLEIRFGNKSSALAENLKKIDRIDQLEELKELLKKTDKLKIVRAKLEEFGVM